MRRGGGVRSRRPPGQIDPQSLGAGLPAKRSPINGGITIYAYAASDPVNGTDPSGLVCTHIGSQGCDAETVTANTGGGSWFSWGDFFYHDFFSDRRFDGIREGAGGAESGGKPQKGFKPNYKTPRDAKQCFVGNDGFLAPSNFSSDLVNKIINAGAAGGLFGAGAVGQGGTFDLQRSHGTAYRQYAAVANIAVGLYLAGAGYSRAEGSFISDNYARARSNNGPTAEQNTFRNIGFDIASGKAKVICKPVTG